MQIKDEVGAYRASCLSRNAAVMLAILVQGSQRQADAGETTYQAAPLASSRPIKNPTSKSEVNSY